MAKKKKIKTKTVTIGGNDVKVIPIDLALKEYKYYRAQLEKKHKKMTDPSEARKQRKQQQEQSRRQYQKQNLTKDYAYTGIPGAKATAKGVRYNRKDPTGHGAGTKGGFGAVKGRKKLQHGGRTNLFEELGRVEAEPSNRNRRAEVSRIHGELNKGYSLGGRVGAAKRGFNKKILRKD